MYVRLKSKLAEMMEGVDLSAYAEGDVFQLDERDATLLIKGGWAVRVDDERVSVNPARRPAIAADRPQ